MAAHEVGVKHRRGRHREIGVAVCSGDVAIAAEDVAARVAWNAADEGSRRLQVHDPVGLHVAPGDVHSRGQARIVGDRERRQAAHRVTHRRDFGRVQLAVQHAVFAIVLGDRPVDAHDQLLAQHDLGADAGRRVRSDDHEAVRREVRQQRVAAGRGGAAAHPSDDGVLRALGGELGRQVHRVVRIGSGVAEHRALERAVGCEVGHGREGPSRWQLRIRSSASARCIATCAAARAACAAARAAARSGGRSGCARWSTGFRTSASASRARAADSGESTCRAGGRAGLGAGLPAGRRSYPRRTRTVGRRRASRQCVRRGRVGIAAAADSDRRQQHSHQPRAPTALRSASARAIHLN